jgi:hypothetical protein
MNVTTVAAGRRTHYAHPENGRTLCGLVGGIPTVGVPQCGRCAQIFHGMSTNGPRP